MNELIKVNYEAGEPTVSARDLYDLLSSQGGLTGTERFSKWFERYIKYGFKENIDFSTPYKKVRVQIEGKREVAREIGMKVRQYFLDLEKAWNTPEQIMARALRIANATVDSLKERCKFLGGQVIEQQKVIETLEPKASYYDLVLQSPDLITTTIIAKDYGMSAKKFNTMLKDMHIQFKLNGNWVLYQEHAGNGYAKYRTHLFEDHEGVGHTKEHLYWTQKGRLFLYDSLKQIGILPEIEK